MDFKKALARGAMKLLEDPRVRKVAQDPRVWQGITTAWNVRGELSKGLDEQARRIAKELGLATPAEIRELKRTIAELRGELAQSHAREDEARPPSARKAPAKPKAKAKAKPKAKAKAKAKAKRKSTKTKAKTQTAAGTTNAPTGQSPRRPPRQDPDPGSEPPPA